MPATIRAGVPSAAHRSASAPTALPALVAKKLRSLSGLEPQVQARRLVGLLGRRGYALGLAHEVVRAALADTELAETGDY